MHIRDTGAGFGVIPPGPDSPRKETIVRPSVGVQCSHCGADIGDQHKPGDGLRLFKAHLAAEHPEVTP